MGTLFEEFQILWYLMSPLFCEKGGTLFKGGHYMREDIIYGNTVYIQKCQSLQSNMVHFLILKIAWFRFNGKQQN